MSDEQDLWDEMKVVKRILAGHKEDYAFFVRAHQQQIFAMIMRAVGEQETAKDLTQEVFIRAYNSLKTFQGNSSFSTWLVRIALNRANSYLSSKSFRNQNQSVNIPDNLMDTQLSTEEGMFSEENVQRLRLALLNLAENHREVLLLCCFEKKTYQEAATILNIPYGTVCSRMNSALRALRRHFYELSSSEENT